MVRKGYHTITLKNATYDEALRIADERGIGLPDFLVECCEIYKKQVLNSSVSEKNFKRLKNSKKNSV